MKALAKILVAWSFTLLGGLFASLLAQVAPVAAQVKGTATYRERIALTPDAVFEATLEDVSDQSYPVLTRGHGNEVQLMLRMVAASKSASKPAQTAPVGGLPASFIGELPCADCPGIRYQLNLFPDRAFFSRMTYLGRSDETNSDDIGSWVVSSDRSTIVLKGGRDTPAMFKIKDDNTLRMLDVEGRDIESSLNYDLRRTKSLEPLDPRLAMRGMYRYFADVGQFTECLTRRKWPVAQEKNNAALESAYTKARLTAGEELLVNLEGQIAMRPKMEGPGAQAALVVERFIAISPGETCSARLSSAPLENTYWKLTRLGGKSVTVAPKQHEPYFVLDNKSKRIAGSGGCNRFTGTYQQNSDRLLFGKMAMTFMACPEGMETERDFAAALEQVRSWKILGEQLELYDGSGGFLARFEAFSR